MQIRAKYFISILLALAVLICAATAVSAVEPRMSDTTKVTVQLTYSGTTAYCTVMVNGADGTTSITDGHLVLTDSNGGVAADWTDISADGTTLFFSDSVSGLTKGKTYTLTFSAKVNRNAGSEDVSNYVSKKC